MGDGSIILPPTPGAISTLIRQDGWALILLVPNLAYDPLLLEQDIKLGPDDAIALRASFAKVGKLKQRLPIWKWSLPMISKRTTRPDVLWASMTAAT
jgi:hypothetical protein